MTDWFNSLFHYHFIVFFVPLFQMLSLLPQRILRLLEFIGFSGNRVSITPLKWPKYLSVEHEELDRVDLKGSWECLLLCKIWQSNSYNSYNNPVILCRGLVCLIWEREPPVTVCGRSSALWLCSSTTHMCHWYLVGRHIHFCPFLLNLEFCWVSQWSSVFPIRGLLVHVLYLEMYYV